MREIKFRAYCPHLKKIFPVESIFWVHGKPLIYVEISGCGNTHLVDGILMQYTGLHDKNGKEIYEGDILSVDDGARYVKIEWHQPSAAFDSMPIKIISNEIFRSLHNFQWPYRTEVIGYIYENPELLKEA